MVGTTPLIIHVADIMPMSKRIRIETPASPTVFLIISSNTVHRVLYTTIDSATHTDDATISATCEAPFSASSGKSRSTRAISAISTANGSRLIKGWGCRAFVFIVIVKKHSQANGI